MDTVGKLELNDDGTVTLPLMGRAPLILPQPSLAQIAELRRLAVEADSALPPIDAIDVEKASPAEVDAFNAQLQARTDLIFGESSPHGLALIAAVKLLTGDDITLADLPAWGGSPRTLGGILSHYQAPLAGQA